MLSLKRVVIGMGLTLLGAIGSSGFALLIGDNLVFDWATPPGRFLTTASETGMIFPLVFFMVALVLGLTIMGIEYFRKE